MRSILLKNNDTIENKLLIVDDDRVHHLTKVCRVRTGDEVLIFDGNGKKYSSKIIDIQRRSISFEIVNFTIEKRNYTIDVCLGIPKKEAFELSLKNCVEIGIENLYTFSSTYSQWKIKNFDRVDALIESAMMQSNNPFLLKVPELVSSVEKLNIQFEEYDYIVLTTLQKKNSINDLVQIKNGKILVVIGPEGGLSPEEESYFLDQKNIMTLNTGGPIMRTPNAISTCVGFVIGKIAGL